MVVLIPIETANRELLYKLYLANLLTLNGFECYLGNKININFLLSVFKSYIYLDKGYHKGVSDTLYRTIKNNNGIIVNLDEEGGVDYSDNRTLLTRYTNELFSNAEISFLWGKHQFDLLKNRFGKMNRVFVSGHPRFELLKLEYQSLYSDEVEILKSRYKKFILINTNFGFGNNIKGDKFVELNYGSRYNNIKDIIRFDKYKQNLFISLIDKISSKLDWTIVIRPHPEEDLSLYKKYFKSNDKVTAIYKGSVIPWLLASEVMIHPDCTTGIESLMLGKKSLSYLPADSPTELVTKLPLEASYRFQDEKLLINFLINKEYRQSVDIKRYDFVEDYFSYSCNTSSIIVNKINTLKNGKNNKKNSVVFSYKDRIRLLYKSIKMNLNFTRSGKLLRNKISGLNYDSIQRHHQNLEKIDKRFRDIEYLSLSKGLYYGKKL